MGNETGLEILENNLLEFTKTDGTIRNANDGKITVSNFKNKYFNLKYKKTTYKNWIILIIVLFRHIGDNYQKNILLL